MIKAVNFLKKSFKKWLHDNDTKIYSTHNEGKSIVAERFIKALKNKIYKHIKAASKNGYFNLLDYIVGNYGNKYHRTIKMKPIDVKSDSFAEYNEESNEKVYKFKLGDNVGISKYKTFFAKGYTPNRSEKVFFISKIKSTVPLPYVVNNLNGEEIIGTFYKKKMRRLIKKNLE